MQDMVTFQWRISGLATGARVASALRLVADRKAPEGLKVHRIFVRQGPVGAEYFTIGMECY